MLHIVNHPLINHKLSVMRNKETCTKDFRDNLDEIAGLLAYEITRDLSVDNYELETPITKTIGQRLSHQIVLVPILRAGLGMVDGIKKMIPTAKIGHIGLYRDDITLKPTEYYAKFPSCIKESTVFVLDPMLATGGSSIEAIKRVKEAGAKDVKLVCLVGVQEGIDNVLKAFDDVDIYLASLDEYLNEDGYIVPGLGDAGDRLFGTK